MENDKPINYIKKSLPFYLTVIIAIIGTIIGYKVNMVWIIIIGLLPFVIYGIYDLRGTRLFN